MAKVIITELQHSGASGANITLDSSKNVTCENNLTVDGTTTLTGAVELPDDTVDIADLSATGTASNSTFLRGDNSWATVSGSKWTDKSSDIYRSSKLGIGDFSSTTIDDRLHSVVSSGTNYIRFTTTDSSTAKSAKFGVNGSGDGVVGVINSQNLIFGTSDTERTRINEDGRWFFGATSGNFSNTAAHYHMRSNYSSGHILSLKSDSGDAASKGILIATGSSGGSNTSMTFEHYAGGSLGSITHNGSSSTYNTGSDYRLKTDVVSITDGITQIKKLTPRRFKWKRDPSLPLSDGFLAHEVAESGAINSIVQGTKDQKDSDNKDVMQSMDYSRLTPLLTAALQEAITKIETLETKVAALEAG